MSIEAKRYERVKKEAYEVLERNRRTTDGHQYTLPSPSTYPYQWFWDSCFHAIVLSTDYPEAAKGELRSMVSSQFENGMLPHMIYWESAEFVHIEWGTGKTSSITQPPMIAEALMSVYQKDGDTGFLRELYQPLCAFYEYLLTARDPRGNHLSGIVNPDESGEDNSPRFDSLLGLPPIHELQENFTSRLKLVEALRHGHFDAPFMKQYFWVKDVPFNAILVKNLQVLSTIAERLEMLDDSERYASEALLVGKAMRERMYDGELFWPTYGESYLKMKVKTWAIFAPMYARILSAKEARHLVDAHLLDEKQFRARYMVPTVSMDEPSFDPDGFWRGPTWIGANWFIFHGLMNYGFREEAEHIARSSLELLELSGFREYFNPTTGEGLGAKDFTWGALALDMCETLRDK
ncbi:MAG TPA: trehalase family glycosidase [Candidatus Paceibacterota bacterium]